MHSACRHGFRARFRPPGLSSQRDRTQYGLVFIVNDASEPVGYTLDAA